MVACDLYLSRSFLIWCLLPVASHPYQFHEVSWLPVWQIHFWRHVTCSAISVALIVPSLLARPYPLPFDLCHFANRFLDMVVLCTLLWNKDFFFFSPLRVFLHRIYGFDIPLLHIIKSLLKVLQVLCFVSAHYFMGTVFWRVLDGAFILDGGVKGDTTPFGLGLGLLWRGVSWENGAGSGRSSGFIHLTSWPTDKGCHHEFQGWRKLFIPKS